ncbi:GNAT family N-acetyltransferase [Streptomyces sp. BE147]|uniref:GNAT family N-acetyltransferase n=1 Tax=Streptomyces sp. BE147 TaxID=3002524 RepID=UPI002E77F3A5|nr:GNAT family N-acetyltransferase [Streptomyces sp. BE147]MEE1738774.1 GNAT family N-acetyltransferase [Streptomyces sp. BE147]
MSGTAHHHPGLGALRDRVTAPSTVELPTVGDGLTWRPATPGDIGLILDLAHAAGRIDHPRSLVTRDELEAEFSSEVFDPERDAVIAVDATGRAVAFGSATAPAAQEPIVRVELAGTVAPDRRGEGIGTALLAWQEARGLQHLAASDATLPGWLAAGAQDHATPAIRLLEEHGYERVRWWLELERDLGAPVAEPPPAQGVRLVPYGEEWTERARSAMNDSFRDHWGSRPVTAAEWASGDRLTAFRSDLSLLAVTPDTHEGERVVGFVFVEVEPDEWPLRGVSFGYLTAVGVRRDARGRGLARTLLAHVLRALRAEGLDHAVLDVDAESPTGALGLYQSLGFTVTDRSVSLVKRF